MLALCLVFTMIPWTATANTETVELDLSSGTIVITETGYAQGGGEETPWTGYYRIIQSDTSITSNWISVAGGSHNITIVDLNMAMPAGFDTSSGTFAPVQITGKAQVIMTLSGESNIENSNDYYPAIFVEESARLTIDAADANQILNAEGKGTRSSGIGAISYGGIYDGVARGIDAGIIIIDNGTINAKATNQAAAIGGGYSRSYQGVQVNGGIVNAEAAGSFHNKGYTGVGIGAAYIGAGGAVPPEGQENTPGNVGTPGGLPANIVMNGGQVFAKGGVSVGAKGEDGYNHTMIVGENAYLYCDGEVGIKSIVDGNDNALSYQPLFVGASKANTNVQVAVDGGTEKTYLADAEGYVLLWLTDATHTYKIDGVEVGGLVELDLTDGSITITKTGYTKAPATEETYHVGTYYIKQTGTTTANTISVESGKQNITIEDLDMQMASDFDSATISGPLQIVGDADVTLVLKGDNTITTYRENNPGVYVKDGAKLKITAEDTDQTLTVTAESNKSTAIGGNSSTVAGVITIDNGTVNATAKDFRAAAIGGGYGKGYKEINILGGIVNATANDTKGAREDGYTGVALGTSYFGNAGIIKIEGGTVNLSGGWDIGARLGGNTNTTVSIGKKAVLTGSLDISASTVFTNVSSSYPTDKTAKLENNLLTVASGGEAYVGGDCELTIAGGYAINLETGELIIDTTTDATVEVRDRQSNEVTQVTVPAGKDSTATSNGITIPEGGTVGTNTIPEGTGTVRIPGKGLASVETDGEGNLSLPEKTLVTKDNGSVITLHAGGSLSDEGAVSSEVGSVIEKKADGTVEITDRGGNITTLTPPDGKEIHVPVTGIINMPAGTTIEDEAGNKTVIEEEGTLDATKETVTVPLYTLIFDGNGAENGTMDSVSVPYGQEVSLPTNEYAKEGYTFAGWAVESDGEVTYADGAKVKNLTATDGAVITLYAIWEEVIVPENPDGDGDGDGTIVPNNPGGDGDDTTVPNNPDGDGDDTTVPNNPDGEDDTVVPENPDDEDDTVVPENPDDEDDATLPNGTNKDEQKNDVSDKLSASEANAKTEVPRTADDTRTDIWLYVMALCILSVGTLTVIKRKTGR